MASTAVMTYHISITIMFCFVSFCLGGRQGDLSSCDFFNWCVHILVWSMGTKTIASTESAGA